MESVVEQLPQAGQLQVIIQASANLNYSAKAAQRIIPPLPVPHRKQGQTSDCPAACAAM